MGRHSNHLAPRAGAGRGFLLQNREGNLRIQELLVQELLAQPVTHFTASPHLEVSGSPVPQLEVPCWEAVAGGLSRGPGFIPLVS